LETAALVASPEFLLRGLASANPLISLCARQAHREA
jgi:hypothetical protein